MCFNSGRCCLSRFVRDICSSFYDVSIIVIVIRRTTIVSMVSTKNRCKSNTTVDGSSSGPGRNNVKLDKPSLLSCILDDVRVATDCSHIRLLLNIGVGQLARKDVGPEMQSIFGTWMQIEK